MWCWASPIPRLAMDNATERAALEARRWRLREALEHGIADRREREAVLTEILTADRRLAQLRED